MKSKTLLLSCGLFATSAFASDYNAQVDFDYFDFDGGNAYNLEGTYYFDKVSTTSTAWAEASFVGQNNNISVNYFDFDGEFDTLGVMGEFFAKDSNFYGNLGVTDTDTDTVINGEIGYFFSENWLVALGTTSSDGIDPVTLRTQYFTSLSDGRFLNVEASIDDEESDLTVSGDYYWTAQSSLGLVLSNSDAVDYGLQFQHFFQPNAAIRLGYTDGDFGDVLNIGLTARF